MHAHSRAAYSTAAAVTEGRKSPLPGDWSPSTAAAAEATFCGDSSAAAAAEDVAAVVPGDKEADATAAASSLSYDGRARVAAAAAAAAGADCVGLPEAGVGHGCRSSGCPHHCHASP
eukprot:453059-Pelagomonas_calceolata.AAC.4